MIQHQTLAAGHHVLVRGQVLHYLSDPGPNDDPTAWEFFEDGGLWIIDGRIHAAGPWAAIQANMPPSLREGADFHDHRGHLVLPGLVDTHLHYPQAGVIGSYGRQLLDWLNDYTFPAEAGFADYSVAERTARYVTDRLLAHGTTTASVYATVHAHSAEAFFRVAEARKLRMLCGKVLMDRNCPDALRDTPDSGRADSAALIERWHGKGRLGYSLTPRFAPTSSREQLQATGELFAAFPDLHLQTHLAENKAEIAWVRTLFPERASYLDVYAHYGLLKPRSIYGHCIHLTRSERREMAASGAAAAFCPTSNFFLGSGAFDYAASTAAGMRVGLATDVGGGTGFSLIRTLGQAYEASQLRGAPLSAMRGWYVATLGGARALYLDAHIGSFQPGREADFTVLDWTATPELAWRMDSTRTLAERLFALMILGDERCVRGTYVMGERAWPSTTEMRASKC